MEPQPQSSPPGQPAPEFRPRRKTQSPALTIALLVIAGVMLVVFVATYMRKKEKDSAPPVVVETTTDTEYVKIQKDMTRMEKLYKEAMNLRTSEDTAAFKAKLEEAKDFLGNLIDRLDAITDPVRDPDTGQLPPDYSGYEREYSRLNNWSLDLTKVSGF